MVSEKIKVMVALTERWDRAGSRICFSSDVSSGQMPAIVFVVQILFAAVLKSIVNLEEVGTDALGIEPRNSIKVGNLRIERVGSRWTQLIKSGCGRA